MPEKCPARYQGSSNWGAPRICEEVCGDLIEKALAHATEYDHFGEDTDCFYAIYTDDTTLSRLSDTERMVQTLDICEGHGTEVGNSIGKFICRNPSN